MVDVSPVVAGTVNEFIDWALFITFIMILYYGVKLLLAGGPTKEEQEEQGRKVKEKLDEMKGGLKKEKEEKKRRDLLWPAHGFAQKAEEAAERLRDDTLKQKTTSAVLAAKREVKNIKSNLNDLKQMLRVARHKTKGEDREYVGSLYNYTEAIIKHFEDNIADNIPKATLSDADWKSQVKAVKDSANTLRGWLGYLMNSIETYVDDEKNMVKLTVPSATVHSGSA
ncbi:hypothetical protein HYX14_06155 [Candidatus Woesearchaeota archaeon]|nr:hypothetical protein [Candidatus Woesearchaeota archaeon]